MSNTAVKVLGGLVALQLLISGVGVATIEEESSLPAEGVLRDTDEPAPESTPGPSAGAPPVAGPDGASVPGPAAEGAGPAGPPPGASIPAPRPGSYRYKQTTRTQSEFSTTTFVDEKTEEVERRIERVSESAGEIVDRRHIPSRVTSNSDDGSKSESRSYEERVWRPGGESLAREVHQSTNTDADGNKTEEESECNWEPDRLQLVFPLHVGLEWSWDSTCSTTGDDGEVTTTNKGRARVTGTRDFDIGGRIVSTFVIELTATEDTSGRLGQERDTTFTMRSDQRTTSFFAPTVGLSVRVEAEHKQDSTFEGSQGGPQRSKTTQTAVADLLSTEPT